MTQDSEKPLDKVRKLLAMADGGTTAERTIALRKAQKLMELHQISSNDLVLDKVIEVKVRISNSHKPRQFATALFNQVLLSFGARGWLQMTISDRYKDITNAVLVGFSPHIEVAEYVLHYLIHQLNHDLKAYKQQMALKRRYTKRTPLKAKTINSRLDSFALGWVLEVVNKLPAALTQSPVAEGSGKAVIPVDILDEYLATKNIKGSYSAKRVKLNEHSANGRDVASKITVRAGVAAAQRKGQKALN